MSRGMGGGGMGGALGGMGGGRGGMGLGRGGISNVQRGPDDDAQTKPLDFAIIRRLWRYTKPYAATRNWLFILTISRGLLLNIIPAVMAWTINGPVAKGDMTGVLHGALTVLVTCVVIQWSFMFRMRLGQQLGESVVHDLRNEIFAHLQSMPMGYFGRTRLGRIISRMSSDADQVRTGVQDVAFVGLVQGVQMLTAACFMAWYDWRLFMLLLALAPVLVFINHLYRKRLSRVYRSVQESFSRVTSALAESVTGIRVTQGFVRQDVNAELFGELVESHGEYNQQAARTTGLFQPLLELNSQVFFAGLLVLGAWFILYGHGSDDQKRRHAEALVSFFFQANLFFSPIQMLGMLYNQALMSMAGAERVFAVLDTKPDWVDAPGAGELPPIQGRVEFQDVDFAYVPDRPVLQDINFTAQPGQTIALVGHTGSGKTTIINLISKFYLPGAGRILIDGHDIVALRTPSLHRQMGIVLQMNFLFNGTVLDNIRVGKPEADEAQVVEAARRLDVLDLMESLPQGFHTPVGEGGRNMSLGQRQIICFTRAMLADPRILILDEATSSVDAMTEARIQQALARLLHGRTSFVVAHRLSTIRQADQILVLDQGAIIERGTHQQLLATGGVYALLYRRFIRAGAR